MRLFTPETWQFQSTPLVRGETLSDAQKAQAREFQSTPLMREETGEAGETTAGTTFQSTPLMRGETTMLIDSR